MTDRKRESWWRRFVAVLRILGPDGKYRGDDMYWRPTERPETPGDKGDKGGEKK